MICKLSMVAIMVTALMLGSTFLPPGAASGCPGARQRSQGSLETVACRSVASCGDSVCDNIFLLDEEEIFGTSNEQMFVLDEQQIACSKGSGAASFSRRHVAAAAAAAADWGLDARSEHVAHGAICHAVR